MILGEILCVIYCNRLPSTQTFSNLLDLVHVRSLIFHLSDKQNNITLSNPYGKISRVVMVRIA